MTNAQDVTYRAIKDLVAGQDISISPPTPLRVGEYSPVLVEVQRGDENITFMIEAGGCLARIYA